jgi:formylglycine-generating enzyme required for sulfatase activity
MGSEPSYFKGSSTLPVEQVSWEESKKFCEKVEAVIGRAMGICVPGRDGPNEARAFLKTTF